MDESSIFIIGGNGQLGLALQEKYPQATAVDSAELDITDAAAVMKYDWAPIKYILNAAAYTNVDGAETSEGRIAAWKVNAVGSRNLAEVALKQDLTIVHISTDYVFDGKSLGFYTEDDEPRPLGVYGKAKLEGELRARNVNPNAIVVRSGWIYGAGGTNFLSRVHLLLAEGRSIKAISDSYGTPTFAGHLAKRLRELAKLDQAGLYHVTNAGGGASYAGFARKAAEIKGYDANLIEDVSVDSLHRPAPRPRSSKLATVHKKSAPLPDWEKALEMFLQM